MNFLDVSVVSKVMEKSGLEDKRKVESEVAGVAEWIATIAQRPEWKDEGLSEELIEKVLIPKTIHSLKQMKAHDSKDWNLLGILLAERDVIDRDAKIVILSHK